MLSRSQWARAKPDPTAQDHPTRKIKGNAGQKLNQLKLDTTVTQNHPLVGQTGAVEPVVRTEQGVTLSPDMECTYAPNKKLGYYSTFLCIAVLPYGGNHGFFTNDEPMWLVGPESYDDLVARMLSAGTIPGGRLDRSPDPIYGLLGACWTTGS